MQSVGLFFGRGRRWWNFPLMDILALPAHLYPLPHPHLLFLFGFSSVTWKAVRQREVLKFSVLSGDGIGKKNLSK